MLHTPTGVKYDMTSWMAMVGSLGGGLRAKLTFVLLVP